jgi:hypothetical protein
VKRKGGELSAIGTHKPDAARKGKRKTYLNVGRAERGDAAYLGPSYTWRLESQHRLEIVVQFRYC